MWGKVGMCVECGGGGGGGGGMGWDGGWTDSKILFVLSMVKLPSLPHASLVTFLVLLE